MLDSIPPVHAASAYGRFLGAYVATVLETFDNVYVFSGDPDGLSEERDTFIVVSSVQPLALADLGERPGETEHLGTLVAWSQGDERWGEMELLLERGRGVILTDDYAPVDNLLAPVFARE